MLASSWIISVNLQGTGAFSDIWLLRVAFVSVTLMTIFMSLLSYSILGRLMKPAKRYFIVIFSIILALLCLSPFVIQGVNPIVDQSNIQVAVKADRGPLYPVVILWLVYIAYDLFSVALRVIRRTKGAEKKRLKIVFVSLFIGTIVAILTNVVLPNLLESTYSSRFAFIAIGLWSVSLTYAILRHKFLEVRVIAARAMAYAMSLGMITGLFISGVAVLSTTQLFGGDLTQQQQFAYVGLAIIIAILYQPMKKAFDRVTNKLFYRDAYDGEAFIDALNKTVVSTIDLEQLIMKSSKIIEEHLKVSTCTFYLRETSYAASRTISTDATKASQLEHVEEIRKLSPMLKTRVFTVGGPSETVEQRKIEKILKKNNRDLMVRLVSTLEYEVEGIGYIFLGPKRSGSLFTLQDQKVLEIIANELVIAIENILRYEEIEQFNVTLQKKIDDATRKLKQTNEKLLALDQAKDEFVSMASHQLRTPLTSIKGYLSMVLEGDAGDVSDTQKQMLGQAFFSSQRMVYLISDLLNVSRLKTGKFIIDAKPINLADVVESEVNQLMDGAKAKDLTLAYTKPKKFSSMMLDEMKIRQVIMNFTDNAIYYTPSGGKITIKLKETPKTIEFTVHDNGIGVPKEQQHKLFTKFYRADNARKTRPDGTGLGIFMAKKVIVAQGGSLLFDSKEGKGSTFGFSFPKEKLAVKSTIDK